MSEEYLVSLKEKKYFNRLDLLKEMRKYNPQITESNFKARLQKFLRDGAIVRIGRNRYCIPQKPINFYQHEYSSISKEIAGLITKEHPLLNFSLFELIQLNEFVNHQLAHNVIFVSVEMDIIDFVFDTLKEKFPGKVFINPTTELYRQYWCDDMIVLEKLVSEAPMGKLCMWHTRIEKMLVDIVADRLIVDTVSPSEFPGIYMGAFDRYVVEESCLLRYATRRGVEKEIHNLIEMETDIILRTEN